MARLGSHDEPASVSTVTRIVLTYIMVTLVFQEISAAPQKIIHFEYVKNIPEYLCQNKKVSFFRPPICAKFTHVVH